MLHALATRERPAIETPLHGLAIGAFFAGLLVSLTMCQSETRTLPPCDSTIELPALAELHEVTVVAAGDIADCQNHDAHRKTARLIERLQPHAVLALGDLAYPNSSLDELVDCYGSSWGRYRAITRPAIGNHEYHTEHAGPFFAYFCGAVGKPSRGYYSFELGGWHVVSLNSNCGSDLDLPPGIADEFGGCGATSPQARWLAEDLAAHRGKCTLAMWHHPRFTSGKQHGDGRFMADLWRVLSANGVDVALAGHVHTYERFAPQDANGNADPNGIRSFVVGTGGAPPMEFGGIAANSEVHRNDAYGLLALTLGERDYTWKFVAAEDGAILDEGTGECHRP
jgi:alkaline phosphatase